MKVQVTGTDFRYARIGLSPLGLHGWADRYWQEYEGLSNDWRESAEAYLLLCRAIELEFKAWHRQGTMQRPLTDRFRHDLLASYQALPGKYRILSFDEVELPRQSKEIYGLTAVQVRMDLAALEAMTRKLIEYGDTLDLAQE